MARLMVLMKELNMFWGKKEIKGIGLFLLILYVITIVVIPTKEIWTLWQTTWWYFVTLTTVGYGDISPTTITGQVWGIVLMVSGIGSLASMLGTVMEYVTERREKMYRGENDYGNYEHHIVLMINRDKQTVVDIIDEIYADANRTRRKIIVVSNTLETGPDPRVKFIKGELPSQDVADRSAIATADKIVIYGENDNETVMTCLSVTANDDDDPAQITARIDHSSSIENIKRVNHNIAIIEPVATSLMIQEMQDPGVSSIFDNIISNHGSHQIFRVKSPTGGPLRFVQFEDLLDINQTLIAGEMASIVHDGMCPDFKVPRVIMPPGDMMCDAVFILAKERPTLELPSGKVFPTKAWPHARPQSTKEDYV